MPDEFEFDLEEFEADLQKYDELITVVREASRVNLEQAALKAQIIKLGETAVTIAKRVPTLAALF